MIPPEELANRVAAMLGDPAFVTGLQQIARTGRIAWIEFEYKLMLANRVASSILPMGGT